MKILSAAILIASVPVTSANAQLGKDASYFCISEFAGGVAYDQATKKWKGTALRTNNKFVLRLKFVNSRVEKTFFRGDEIVHDYNITFTETGSNSPEPCIDVRQSKPRITVGYDGLMTCTSSLDLNEYIFNLTKNRFLATYLIGYIDGKDSNENTPAVSGGICAKID